MHLHQCGHTCVSPTPRGHRGPWANCLALPAPWAVHLPQGQGGGRAFPGREASLPPSPTPQAQLTSTRPGLPRRKGTAASSHQYFAAASHEDQKLGLSSLALIFWSCPLLFPLLMNILCQKIIPRMVSWQRMATSSPPTSTRRRNLTKPAYVPNDASLHPPPMNVTVIPARSDGDFWPGHCRWPSSHTASKSLATHTG